MQFQFPTAVAAIGAALVVTTLSACSGGAAAPAAATSQTTGTTVGGQSSATPSGAPSTATSGPASVPSTQPAVAPAQGKLNGVPSACPPADEVMSNLSLSGLVVDGRDPSTCEYLLHGNNASPYVLITFNAAPPGFTPAQLGASLQQGQSDVKAVPGLGDAAFSFGGNGTTGLTFLSGGTICSIATTVPSATAGKVSLAKAILGG